MFFKKRPVVVFVYSERYKDSGSTIMRGEQLLGIVKKYYRKEYRLYYRPLSANFTKSILYFTKGAIMDASADQIKDLKERDNIVLFDPVDSELDEEKAKYAEIIIAASLEAHDYYLKKGYTSCLINHHVDTRLNKNGDRKPDKVRIGYFGELVNTIITDAISAEVDFVQVDTSKQDNYWLDQPRQYNVHYALRKNNNSNVFKPFLKGFTAAACMAVIIIQRDQAEAVRWLGQDYPYLTEPNPTEEQILDMINLVRSDFLSARWMDAQRRMQVISSRISNRAIANEFYDAINQTSQSRW